MSRNIFLIVMMLTLYVSTALNACCQGGLIFNPSNIAEQDTVKERQILYNGILWKNMFHRIQGDQFLFSEFFMPGTISINGKTFKNLRIKYDILSDEIITPLNNEDIVQLNKEMVDSFTITYENKVYLFTQVRNDTLKGFGGYMNLLYNGNSAFYIKYKKSVSYESRSGSDGYFIQINKMYLMKENIVHQIDGTKTLSMILGSDKGQIRNFIRKNKLKVSKMFPESYVPVIEYLDKIR